MDVPVGGSIDAPSGVSLSGTGPRAGTPVPGCRCAWCRAVTPEDRRDPVAGVTVTQDGSFHRTLDVQGGTVRRLPGLLWAPQIADISEEQLTALRSARLPGAVLGSAEPDGGEPTRVVHQLSRLRAVDALSPDADVVLVGVGHRWPPVERLRVLLDAWAARIVPDGTTLWPNTDRTTANRPLRTLVLGPSSSGKSRLAEDLLAADPVVTYIAAGAEPAAGDAEWADRIRAHRERRPDWWSTLETPDAATAMSSVDSPVLLDAVGTWLAAAMDRTGAWEGTAGWRENLDDALDQLITAWRERTEPLVAVGEEVGWSIVPATAAGRLFRDELGRLNQRLAAESDRVLLVIAGRMLDLGGAGTTGAPAG